MFTLSEASKDTKEILKWLAIILGTIVAVLLAIRLFFFVKELLYPTPPPKPSVSFGVLQPQVFPDNKVNQNFTYTLNTLTGQLPNLNEQLKIYRMQPVIPDLLAVNKFNQKVVNIGFLSGATAVSNTAFQWRSNTNIPGIPRTLTLDTLNNNFTITSNYKSDPEVLAAVNLSNKTRAIDLATQMLNSMQLIPLDVDQSKTGTNLFYIQNGSLSTASSLSNAQIIEVYFLQKDIDKLPIYYEDPNSSNISILVAAGGYQGQIVGAKYIPQTISDQSSTYPIKSAKTAFDELKQGKGYIAAYFGTTNNITISDVFLAYYIAGSQQDFLMPIFVFKGNDGFYAYVPAVTDEWISR